MSKRDTNLIGIKTDFVEEDDETLTRKHTQSIPQWFLDGLKQERDASRGQREGDFMRVASIPTVVVEKWMRAEIVARLKAENLDGFLTTDKSI